MRNFQTVHLFIIAAGVSAASASYAAPPREKEVASDTLKFEVGKHYHITVEESDGEESVTTTYWATVQQTDERSVTLADGEWSQVTGHREKRPNKALMTLMSRIHRLFGGKRSVGIARGIPMEDDTVILPLRDITIARPMTDDEFRLRKEADRSLRRRPPHVARLDDFDQ